MRRAGILLQLARIYYRYAADSNFGARIKESHEQQHHGAAEVIAILVFVVSRPSSSIRKLSSFRAKWLARNSDGGSIVFFTYIGFIGIHGCRGMHESATRLADRYHRDAGHLHALVHRLVVVLTGWSGGKRWWTMPPPWSTL